MEFDFKELQVEPREYQIEGSDFLVKSERGILGDDMGLGKTGQAFMAWRKLNIQGPVLLIGKPAAQSVWIDQAEQWGMPKPLVISGSASRRAKKWAEIGKGSFVACTIQSLKNDLQSDIAPRYWSLIIYDEAHRVNNRKTTLWTTVKKLRSPYMFLLSGSPMRKGFEDLWALLNLCDPKTFSSYWSFVQTFGYTQINEHGAWEVMGLKEKDLLIKKIRPYFLRRLKIDVLPELPPKQRILDLRIHEMQAQQKKQYYQMMDELISELTSGDIIVAQSQLVKLIRLRQILCCPKILDPETNEYGASLELLGDMLEETDDHHFVVFTPFTGAIQYIAEFLLEKLPGANLFGFRGGLKPEEVNNRSKAFRETKGIAICSVAFAESFELTPAKWAYFNQFSWSIVENLQAEDRLHRMTTTDKITYYYPTHTGGIDLELMRPVLDEKSTQVLKVYNTHRLLREALIHARERS